MPSIVYVSGTTTFFDLPLYLVNNISLDSNGIDATGTS